MGHFTCFKNLLEGLLLSVIVFGCQTSAFNESFSRLKHHWGYEDVRPGAHMFWWLIETIAQESDKPLIIWLQGGPGVSGTAYGNFEEIGPYDTNLKWRNHTWIKDYNVLFIDAPVGTGFSYVENESGLCSDFGCITIDLMTCIKGFLRKFPKFIRTPTYVFAESYAGLYAVELASFWHQEQLRRNVYSNFRGIGLVSASISIPYNLLSRPKYFLNAGLIDLNIYNKLSYTVNDTMKELENKNVSWENVLQKLIVHNKLYAELVSGVDYYKINRKVPPNHKTQIYSEPLKNIMMRLKDHLRLKSDWNSRHMLVGIPLHQTRAYYKSVLKQLEELLTNTNIKVIASNGQYDGIVTAAATLSLLDEMNWPQKQCWLEAPRTSLVINGMVEGFSKECGNFKHYSISRSGHMIPADNPAAMEYIVKDLIYGS